MQGHKLKFYWTYIQALKINFPRKCKGHGIWLTNEAKEKLKKFRPLTVGQAARIDGITPATITAILAYLGKLD